MHWLWPNVTLNVEPGPQNLSLDVWFPDGPGRTAGLHGLLLRPRGAGGAAEELMAFSRQVADEDAGLVEAVQRGMASGAVPTGA